MSPSRSSCCYGQWYAAPHDGGAKGLERFAEPKVDPEQFFSNL